MDRCSLVAVNNRTAAGRPYRSCARTTFHEFCSASSGISGRMERANLLLAEDDFGWNFQPSQNVCNMARHANVADHNNAFFFSLNSSITLCFLFVLATGF